jgi:hypothetical protein
MYGFDQTISPWRMAPSYLKANYDKTGIPFFTFNALDPLRVADGPFDRSCESGT